MVRFMDQLIEKTIIEVDDNGNIVFIGGICKARAFRRVN